MKPICILKQLWSWIIDEFKNSPLQSTVALIAISIFIKNVFSPNSWWILCFIILLSILLFVLHIKKGKELFAIEDGNTGSETEKRPFNFYGFALVFLIIIIIISLFVPFTGNYIDKLFWPTKTIETTPTFSSAVTPISPTSESVTTTFSPIPNITLTKSPSNNLPPTIASELSTVQLTIAITEIMANPCGWNTINQNEYIEIYNYGEDPIDVEGWFVSTSQQDGPPDKIISWGERNEFPLGTDVIINSTIIESHQFAIILSPYYHLNDDEIKMPYIFPPNTVILTIAAGNNLGNKLYGIRGDLDKIQDDGVFIFTGTEMFISKAVSTYSIEIIGTSPNSQNRYKASLPISTFKCDSVQRKVVNGDDIAANWETVKEGNPGKVHTIRNLLKSMNYGTDLGDELWKSS